MAIHSLSLLSRLRVYYSINLSRSQPLLPQFPLNNQDLFNAVPRRVAGVSEGIVASIGGLAERAPTTLRISGIAE